MKTKSEIEELIRKEKEDYDKARTEFYADPLHWSNNKRRLHGLAVLRGKTNKNRRKKFRSFKLTPTVFFTIEDLVEDTLKKNLDNKLLDSFVDIKEVNYANN